MLRFRELPHNSSQYKEVYDISLALKKVKGPLNLFFRQCICCRQFAPLAVKSLRLTRRQPTHPLFMQVSILLQERASPHAQCEIAQSPATEGNTLTHQTTSTGTFMVSTELADQFHSRTHTNKKGLHAHFPHITLLEPQRIIKTCSSCASLLSPQLYRWWVPITEASISMSYGKSMSSISSIR